MARDLKLRIYEVEGLYYPCSENKGQISFVVTVKLICAFVSAYAKSRFSDDVAHMLGFLTQSTASQLNIISLEPYELHHEKTGIRGF